MPVKFSIISPPMNECPLVHPAKPVVLHRWSTKTKKMNCIRTASSTRGRLKHQ